MSSICVYIPRASLRNLSVGLARGTWGFKGSRDEYTRIAPGDELVIGLGFSGGSPRVAPQKWRAGRLERIIHGRVGSTIFEANEPLWPDEIGKVIYPYRFRFDVVRRDENVSLSPEGALTPAQVDGLRWSAINQGQAAVVVGEGESAGQPSAPAPTSLRACLTEIAKEWPGYLQGGKVQRSHRAYELVVDLVPSLLRSVAGAQTGLLFEGPTGRGNITPAPWIATFDPEVTSKATSGFYPVFLFSVDLSRVYLSLAFGVTEFSEQYGEGQACLDALATAADFMRTAPGLDLSGVEAGALDLGAKVTHKYHWKYQHSAIVSIRYDLDDLPLDPDLVATYRRFLLLYRQLIDSGLVSDVGALAEAGVEPPTEIPTIAVEEFEPPRRATSARAARGSSTRRRSRESRKVGRQGERIVYENEKRTLAASGRADLAAAVDWVAERGMYPGYDIKSFELDGTLKLIEVKSTAGRSLSTLEITVNEWNCAVRESGLYLIYLVTRALSNEPRIFAVRDPATWVEDEKASLSPSSYQLDFRQDAQASQSGDSPC